jgi:3-oxoacyl-[acyl-carrier protein] reductase
VTLLQKHLDRLRGKTAWITGGKRIGRVVARALAEQKVNIVVSYRHSKGEADEVVAELRQLGVRTLAVQADVSDRLSVQRAIESVRVVFPEVHILVNMASVFEPVTFENVGEVDWTHNIGAHVLGTFWPTQLLVPFMPAGSHIINIADRTSIGPVYTGNLAYVVTKGAVETMTRAYRAGADSASPFHVA